MMFFVILLVSFGFVLFGKHLFQGWYNHISIYSGIWGFSLAALQLDLIAYYPLSAEAWILIIAAWCAFFLGSVTVPAARFARLPGEPWEGKRTGEEITGLRGDEQRLLRTILWVLSGVSLLVVLQHWYIVVQKFGSIANVLVWGNIVYSFRVEEGIPGAIPYFDSLALTGTLLAGVYTAKSGRIRFIAVLPFLVVMLNEVANMGRAKLVMAAILWLSGYAFTRQHTIRRVKGAQRGRIRRVLVIIVALALLIGGAEFVRSTRGATETFRGARHELYELSRDAFLTPSMYLYATSHPVVFSQYLKSRGEDPPLGGNTLAPLYRILAKLGFDVKTTVYQRFYKVPITTNTGTYLRELHADFGVAGVFVFPYVLGFLATIAWLALRARFRYTLLATVSYLYALVAMSILYVGTRAGDLLFSAVAAYLVGAFIDLRLARKLRHSRAIGPPPLGSGAPGGAPAGRGSM
jgi:oligosaccharide repeat unit polymerase